MKKLSNSAEPTPPKQLRLRRPEAAMLLARRRITICVMVAVMIVITPGTTQGSILYASDLGGYMACVDPSTGAMTKLPHAMGVGLVQGLAYDFDHQTMYGVTGFSGNSNLITVNLTTGQGTVIGQVGSYGALASLAYNPSNGFLYATDTATKRLLTINPATGAPTVVGTLTRSDTGALASVYGLDFDTTGKLFGSGTSVTGQGIKELYEINPVNAAVTFLCSAHPADFVGALSFDPVDGQAYGVQSYLPGPVSQLLRVNIVTGETYVVADFTDIGLGNVSGLAAVPEPATICLLGLGALSLLRRKR